MQSMSMNIINDATCGGGGEKRTNQEMTQASDSDDALTLFKKAQDRLRAAQLELDLAQQNMERRRQQFRAGGNYEPDSLLRLNDGEGHLIAHIIEYLDIDDLGRCGEVCRTLKNQTDGCWDAFETKVMTHPSLRSPSAQNSKERVARYLRASAFAERIGAMGDNISKHIVVMRDSEIESVRCHNHCEGCDFPNMNFDHTPSTDEYELFVRFSKTSNNELLAEGFPDIGYRDVMLLKVLDFSNWSELLEINRRIDALGYKFGWLDNGLNGGDDFDLLKDVMSNLTVVVVAVKKLTSEVSLVAAKNDFGGEINLHIGTAQGTCTHEGELLPRSHVSFDRNGVRKRLELDFFTVMVSPTTGNNVNCNCYWKLRLEDVPNELFFH